jgi:chemotaxis protein methyltransferase CheR
VGRGQVTPPDRPDTTEVVDETESIEVDLVLEAVWRRYGYDFRGYSPTHVRRRLRHLMREERAATLSGLQERLLHDAECMQRLLASLSVNVTSMFRNPDFFRTLRREVLPLLRTYPSVRIWHAGCATGEEVYSMAILLEEEGLTERCRVYATDMSDQALATAKAGSYPLSAMQGHTAAYLASGGHGPFSRFYLARGGTATFAPHLRKNVLFARHNLATDGSFNEFHLVVCRNVLIYFGRGLQDRAHRLLYESLPRLGILALGSKETIRFTPYESRYETFADASRLYRKVA